LQRAEQLGLPPQPSAPAAASPGPRSGGARRASAALSAVTRLAQAGEEILAGDDLYGGTCRLLSQVAARHGIRVR
jgi:cystathionine beta-lyase